MHRIRKKMNMVWRFAALFLAIVFAVSAISVCGQLSVSAAESGSCGNNLQWSYTVGTLIITGSGDMFNFSERNMAPWYDFANDIVRVVLPKELSNIGRYAFCECKNLRFITIPDSVTAIGDMAFYDCENLEMLSLGKSLRRIGYNAFYNCKSLKDVRLPYGLESIGYQAFYRCESLTNVTVPADVKEMGTSVFAYCKSLIRAVVNARLTTLPGWTFFGCENLKDVVLCETFDTVGSYTFRNCDELSVVYFEGDDKKTENILQGIIESLPSFSEAGYISPVTPNDVISSDKVVDNNDGTLTQSNTTIREDEHVKVVTSVDRTQSTSTIGSDGEIIPPTDSKDSYTANLIVTVEDGQGWDSVQAAIQDALKDLDNTYSTSSKLENTQLTLQIKDGGFKGESILSEIAKRDIKVTVITSSGSEWRFEGENVDLDEIPSNINFSYMLYNASDEICEKLGSEFCYMLKFDQSAVMKAEVLIALPSAEYSNAFLYQIENNGKFTLLQSVAVDQNANAHFFLASVDADTEYIIGLNVPGESTENVLIPDELLPQYGGNAADRLTKWEFVTTGVKSSWGLSVKQVTWIMVGVLVGCIVIVGIVMGVRNKTKSRKPS